MTQNAGVWCEEETLSCLPVNQQPTEMVLPDPQPIPAPPGVRAVCYVNQRIMKHHGSSKGSSERTIVACQRGLVQCSGGTMKRCMRLQDIAEIRVWVDTVHIRAEPSARLRDWLFSMQQPEVHMATVDQLRMLMVAEPCSVLTTDRPIDMQTVRHKQQPGMLDCRTAFQRYAGLATPRMHKPGSVWSPTLA
eukprot:TRINITY_DN4529_c0_g1_i1.p2 TRINITY_DN4529_c0_g1~~TRINITY_DN4529_c0_g1_i1.p2  ORF type:complete len:191 (+),score=65.77 TRINITY_DN4529_c0_g1_i1:78-650(+)